jgi:TolA-binding protein
VELAAGRFDAAEALARTEAERLLAGPRKDRLAEVYRDFARRLLEPEEPVTPPDPEGAYALLAQARGLAKGDALRAALLLAMGRASQEAGNHARAVGDFQSYLAEYPEGADRAAARFLLGEAQLAAGQPLPARLTWTDLARDLEGRAAADGAIADVRARALYRVARTYGIPTPPDDAQLGLGVAALRRALAAYPAHPEAVRAAYEIGAACLARGKSQEALAALTAFLEGQGFRAETEEARRLRAALAMTATFQVGQIRQGQEEFARAIDAFNAYLRSSPTARSRPTPSVPSSTPSCSSPGITSAASRYAEARAAWQAFAAQNPLDARVPGILFQVGESFAQETQYDAAIAAWDVLIGKFPGGEPPRTARFRVALIYEEQKADPEAALERLRKVAVEPWQSQAGSGWPSWRARR